MDELLKYGKTTPIIDTTQMIEPIKMYKGLIPHNSLTTPLTTIPIGIAARIITK